MENEELNWRRQERERRRQQRLEEDRKLKFKLVIAAIVLIVSAVTIILLASSAGKKNDKNTSKETETTEAKKLKNAVTVHKCPAWMTALYPVLTALLITAGVLMMTFRPIRQYFVASIILLILSVVPILYLLDALVFRLMIGTGKIVLRKLASAETAFAYTDVSWSLQTPDKKRSAILLYAKDKPIARILPGAKSYNAVLSLRHKGSLTADEKKFLKRISEPTEKSS